MSRHSEALAGLLRRAPLPGIAAAAAEHDAAVLCVGGAVRDALLGRQAADVDVAVAGDLDAFVARFAHHCGRTPVAIGDDWRDTRRTMLGATQVDIGRMLGDERQDLAARDFTINAMALRLAPADVPPIRAPELLDPHGGVADLERRVIRMLSAGALEADPLRLLRAVRYAAVLDGFDIDEQTLAAIRERAPTIVTAAAERVQAEWAALLAAPGWAEGARLAFATGLGEHTLGCTAAPDGFAAWQEIAARGADGAAPEHAAAPEQVVALRLAAVLAVSSAPPGRGARVTRAALIERRWPRRVAQRATRIAHWALALTGGDDGDLTAWVLEDRDAAAAAARLAAALAGDADEAVDARIATLRQRAARAAEEPWVTGSDLRSWGIEQGPQLGELLHEAARGQLERRWPSAEDARTWARRHAGAAAGGAN